MQKIFNKDMNFSKLDIIQFLCDKKKKISFFYFIPNGNASNQI